MPDNPTNLHAKTIGSLSFLPFDKQGWKGWRLQSWGDFTPFEELDAWLAEPGHDVVLDVPCRTIFKQETPAGTIYAKLMRAQNDGVLRKKEWFSMFKWKYYPSRAKCILKTTAEMLACGHNCPMPILGVRRSNGSGLPTDLYVATELADPTVEQRLMDAGSVQAQKDILAVCGRRLAHFHGDGFVHGDFLPRNTCLDMKNERFSYLDNDRTRRWPNVPIFHFKRRNLTQFCFNLYILNHSDDPELPNTFIQAYADEAKWNEKRFRSEADIIFSQNAQRWKKTAMSELARRDRETQACRGAQS